MLQINQLQKRYDTFSAVDGLDFQVERGQIFGFVGPNGAGKTTTMKIICGLLKADGGSVKIDGIDVKQELQKAKTKIGYMPDFFGVYDDLKVDEYLDFFADIYHIPHGDRKKLIPDLLELVDLSEKYDAYVDGLSRGMKQRLCLARCMVHNPELLILDEPASGMDPRARYEMKETLRTLQSMGKTILISSHILTELAEVCSHIGIINQGKMIVSGSVDEVMQRVRGGGNVRVRTGENARAMEVLQELPMVRQIAEQGRELSVLFDGGDEVQAEILRHLIGSGLSVYAFAESGGSLEDVFMEVTSNESEI